MHATFDRTFDQTVPALRPFLHQQTVLLTSYRRNGTPVGTPVSLVVDRDHAYFRSYESAWKVKRIRRNPHVDVAPSTLRGKPTGPAIHAQARMLTGEEAATASRAITHKHPILHGMFVPLYHRLAHLRTVHFELRPIEG